MRSDRGRVALVSLGVIFVTVLGACGGDELTRFRPPFEVVDGTPVVDTGLPTIDDQQPVVNPDDFANNAPIQLDVYFQKTVRKVDILWVVDNSCSMVDEQTSLAANFSSFIADLTAADPPVDYHLGIITADAGGEGGALRPLATAPTERFIACNTDGTAGCNVPDEQQAFEQTIAVGVSGGAIEKGLMAAHLALVDPMKSTVNAGFLRDDAALYIIMVSDEGDASCEPLEACTGCTTDFSSCNFAPYCRCGNSVTLGSVDYFVRFFEGLKGYGNESLVAVAAIVATASNRLDIGGQIWTGCSNPGNGSYAFYAPRYVDVATRTGGITTSICDDDFSAALSALGFAVSGQRRDFPLSRRPIDPNIAPIRVTMQTDPFDAATKQDVPAAAAPGADGWEYILCESGNFVNAIRFNGTWVPPPKARIEVTYQVDVGGGRSCI